MSGILRNTLRFVGTTKYLRTMTLTTSCINNSLSFRQPKYLNHNEFEKLQFIQAKKISTDFGTIIQAARQKILSILSDEEIKKSNIDRLTVSLSSGKVGLIIPRMSILEKKKCLIFPPKFSTELDGKPIKPKSNKKDHEKIKKLSFTLGEWNVALDGDELKLKVKDSDETFILKHTVHVKVHKAPTKPLEDGGVKSAPTILFSNSVINFPAKIISKSEGQIPLEKSFPPVDFKVSIPPKKFLKFGGILVGNSLKDSVEITDEPNIHGRMKLKFPMTASLEGAQQTIQFNDTDDTLTVYHTVEIQAYKNKLHENLNNEMADKEKDKTSNVGTLRMELESGDLIIEPRDSRDQSLFIRHEVDIEIDLDSEVPSILINPSIKRNMSTD